MRAGRSAAARSDRLVDKLRRKSDSFAFRIRGDSSSASSLAHGSPGLNAEPKDYTTTHSATE